MGFADCITFDILASTLEPRMQTPLVSSRDSQMELAETSVLMMETETMSRERDPSSSSSCKTICSFSSQEHSEFESKERTKSARKLSCLIAFYLLVMVAEIVGGLVANSLAVMADAAHLLTDIASFSISLFTLWVSSWNATPHQSFGFNRLEVLGALLSIQLIWVISAVLIYEAIERLVHEGPEVDGKVMFAVAAFGFLMNLIMVLWLGHDHHDHHSCGNKHHCHDGEEERLYDDNGEVEETNPFTTKFLNINLQGAYIHVMADMIQSFGVTAGGAVIWAKPKWLVIDLVSTFVFSCFALVATLPMLKDIFGVLMESAPSGIDCDKLKNEMKFIKGVQGVHDLHVWAITIGRIVLSCHVVAESGVSSSEIIDSVRDFCEKTYGIRHVTVQVDIE